MADLEDFFKKKDKKKKGEKKFATVNTDELAKNLDQMAVKEEMARKKEISESCSRRAEVSFQSNKKKEKEPSNKQSKNVSGKLRNTPKEVAAVELIIRTITSGPVGKDGTWEPIDLSSIEHILHFALNATETESKYSGKTTEATAKITSNKKGNPNKLIINDITAVVMNKEDWPVERVVFRLREQGPTFSAKCPSKLRKDMSTRVREYSSTGVLEYYLSSPIIIRLSVNLKKVSTSSQIKVNVTNKAPQEPARKKEISERQSCSSRAEVSFQSNKKKEREPSNKQSKKAKGMQQYPKRSGSC